MYNLKKIDHHVTKLTFSENLESIANNELLVRVGGRGEIPEKWEVGSKITIRFSIEVGANDSIIQLKADTITVFEIQSIDELDDAYIENVKDYCRKNAANDLQKTIKNISSAFGISPIVLELD